MIFFVKNLMVGVIGRKMADCVGRRRLLVQKNFEFKSQFLLQTMFLKPPEKRS